LSSAIFDDVLGGDRPILRGLCQRKALVSGDDHAIGEMRLLAPAPASRATMARSLTQAA
jgi:hypothetical protein